jgi:uncharacterized membrane protein
MKKSKPISMDRRIILIDAARGGAVMAMIFYHLGFDLNYLHWIHQNLNYDLRWMTARSLILGSFLLTMGASTALAENHQVSRRRRWERVGKIAAAAALVTAGSWMVVPNTAIYVGTLHAIALMSLILLLFPIAALPAGILGVGMIALGNICSTPLFNHSALAWFGLMTYKPLTLDYVPLLPWFGVCLVGYGIMKTLTQKGWSSNPPHVRLPGAFLWMGRHSLPIYLLHEPLLLGILIPVTCLLKP